MDSQTDQHSSRPIAEKQTIKLEMQTIAESSGSGSLQDVKNSRHKEVSLNEVDAIHEEDPVI